MSNITVETHLIQNFAPSNLNRDDTNQPKDCEFGGVRRARISSQCIKRSIRTMLSDLHPNLIGFRTKRIKDQILKHLSDLDIEQETLDEIVEIFIAKTLSKMEKGLTAVLIHLGHSEVEAMADQIRKNMETLENALGNKDAKKTDSTFQKLAYKTIKEAQNSVDVALFGRMLAELPEFRVDAASQVAHAISTHRVDQEFDFYTAVDDLNPGDETGAGMIGHTGFNSACFYRYQTLDYNQLLTNLKGDEQLAEQALEAFLEASVKAIPTGKQNSFAAQNLPVFGLFIVRKNGLPISLANAFGKAINPDTEKDLRVESINHLDKHLANMTKVYGECGLHSMSAFSVLDNLELDYLKDSLVPSLQDALDKTVNSINN